MIILRLLGSSDDKEKEKIGVARPKGPPLRGFFWWYAVFQLTIGATATRLGGLYIRLTPAI
jgi:hypothetical protein